MSRLPLAVLCLTCPAFSLEAEDEIEARFAAIGTSPVAVVYLQANVGGDQLNVAKFNAAVLRKRSQAGGNHVMSVPDDASKAEARFAPSKANGVKVNRPLAPAKALHHTSAEDLPQPSRVWPPGTILVATPAAAQAKQVVRQDSGPTAIRQTSVAKE